MRLRHRFCTVQCAAIFFGLSGILVLAGCGDGKIGRYPVNGAVKVDGQPAEGAVIIFCPVNAGPELQNLRPAGKTDAAGAFKLTTIDAGDGAPAGQYKVLVLWPSPVANAADDRGGRASSMGPDRLKGKYYNLPTTPLTATIEKKSNELPPFDLTTK